MNCKQGDLARIVGATGAAAQHNGKIVRCVSLVDWDGPSWVVDPQIGRYWLIADERLRPIRDPGDDAKDETLAWKPVPRPQLIPLKVRGEVSAE